MDSPKNEKLGMEQTFRILSDILNGSIGCSSADQSCSFFNKKERLSM
jgi:hypothetical protein